jgi:hypothetical protein
VTPTRRATAADWREVLKLTRPDTLPVSSRPHLDCDACGSGGRLLSAHPTSAGTVRYIRCSCGVLRVVQDGEVLAIVKQP